ncbi:MAG: PTS sugar transporter subunit IIA [[Actinobacillus] rossii]|uniref:Putative PTS IIA-like nitrogen-regulatory protein PtsN n=1 Tax=[Actinobacillus] rossii TaxID=123820 RepID=A0A380TM99_9PAST|nr:PTS sugar transporter subunit IIA [[Actinobacillus] rossii]MDY3124785.1 PTS sugar transporter subunit IIA [[Actinobacillus] rossii]MDY4506031.1 PTS sugar transporter subunit IIA [[Actinobacillus] rossii]SUT88362.1 putative PTS IIA-like nitrogen-regulatory protein PtsN [[Actinobacillus] rossii]
MLKQFLPLNHIQLIDSVDNWKQAVQYSAEPLLSEKLIEPRYVECIFQLHQKIGPYYVIAPQIAMPHSRPEDGVNEQALSLVVLKQGINFGSDNDPVHIILMLAAKDNTSHLEMLSTVAELFSDENTIQQIIQSTNKAEIANIVYRY